MKRFALFSVGAFCALCTLLATLAMDTPLFAATRLSPEEARRVGQRVWQNECAGTVEGLVSWNKGEAFPSLGIGHFIWYSEGRRGPFEESFPRLAALLRERGVPTPEWIHGAAPWKTAAEMNRDSARVKELRALLSGPKALEVQAEFLIARLDAALPKMLKAAPVSSRDRIRKQFARLVATPEGSFALIDYVNFKGEGVSPEERYKGEGWGLLQVLEGMKGTKEGGDAVREFSDSARRVLARRVKNSPPERGEQRWLPGWQNRVGRY